MKRLRLLEKPSKVEGYVRVSLNGKPYWEGPNLVTDGGLAFCARLLAGASYQVTPTQYETVDTMLIGNGGADTTGSFPTGLGTTPTEPIAPERTDTQLVSQILNIPVPNALANESGNTVIFTSTFAADDYTETDFPAYGSLVAGALFVNEFGLYVSAPASLSPILFARVCVPAISFAPTSGYTIAVEWTVGFF